MKQIAIIIGLMLACSIFFFTCSYLDNGAQTIHKEYDPSAMLNKYEWFKSQAQFIQKSDQDVVNVQKLKGTIKTQFETDNGKDHSTWDPVTKSAYQSKLDLLDQQEQATVATRNKLVADYNTKSSEFNWEPFKGKSDLPPQTYQQTN